MAGVVSLPAFGRSQKVYISGRTPEVTAYTMEKRVAENNQGQDRRYGRELLGDPEARRAEECPGDVLDADHQRSTID